MMKAIFMFLGIIAAANAQNSCDGSFKAYLEELKNQIGANAENLETEFVNDYYKLCRQCFASSSSDSSKCVLTDDELKANPYGENGPMKGCPRCQGMATSLRDKFMHSSPETRKCFRKHLSAAIREELEPCIQGKISNGYQFHVPDPLPDFEEKTFNYMEKVETSINYHVIANSRCDACKSVNPARYGVTGPCLDSGYPGIYSAHCKAAKNARKAVPSGCDARFDEVKGATCKCMDEKRAEWHTKFEKVKNIVDNAQSGTQCGIDIINILGAWLGKIQNAMKDCLPNSKVGDLQTVINLGCGQVVNGGIRKNELTIGFRFVRLLLDALNDRLLAFCDRNCKI